MKRFTGKLGLVASALFLLGGGSFAACAQESANRTATPIVPAILDVEAAKESLERITASNKRGYVEIEIVGYEPGGAGSVQIVVQLAGISTEDVAAEFIEIGRFAVFPNAMFDSATPGTSQFFGFPLPENFATSAEHPDLRMRVSIEAEHPAVSSASVKIGDIRLTTR